MPGVALQMVVTGAHLSPAHGSTYTAIEADGFHIDWKVDNLLVGDGAVAISKSFGLCVQGMAEALEHLRPDVVVLLGDRYEMLAAASAAMIARIPIAHLHGGETTEGAIDEAIRHAITKMAHLHFCAAAPYRNRIIQLGERPERVFDVGAPGLDHLTRTPMMSRAELEADLGMPLGHPLFLVTYHPVTLDTGDQGRAVKEMLAALDAFPTATVVFTGVNADPNYIAVAREIEPWVETNQARAYMAASLGQRRYLSLMREADVVIGNSSSGIIEAPALHTPTVNIGTRQQGRLRSATIIDCVEACDEIRASIQTALDEAFIGRAKTAVPAYGSGDSSRRIAELLRDADLDGILMKPFHDTKPMTA